MLLHKYIYLITYLLIYLLTYLLTYTTKKKHKIRLYRKIDISSAHK